jgi:hypothetical protein
MGKAHLENPRDRHKHLRREQLTDNHLVKQELLLIIDAYWVSSTSPKLLAEGRR